MRWAPVALPRLRGVPLFVIVIAVAVAAVAAGSGCSGAEGVALELLFDEDRRVDRVRITGDDDGEEAFAPGELPDPPRELSSGDSLSVLVPPGLVGERVRFTLEGRFGDEVRVRGTTTVRVREGEIVEREVRLEAIDQAPTEELERLLASDEASLRAALALARDRAGPDTIVVSGEVSLGSTVVIDDPAPVEIMAGAGGARISRSGLVFHLVSPGVTLRDLRVVASEQAVLVEGEGAALVGLLVEVGGATAAVTIHAVTRIERMLVAATSRGDVAIAASDAAALDMSRSLVLGPFSQGLVVSRVASLRLEHVSLLPRTDGATGLALADVAVCARGNVVAGLAMGSGATLVSCGSGSELGPSGRNALVRGGCSGAGCGLCGDGGALCDVEATSDFEIDGACPRPSSGLVDAGEDFGQDLVDDGEARWVGPGPDIGAKERGASMELGDKLFTCP